jgi:RimJ/RimL family protein N-acetyltransferase/predicted ATP-grasp superfamily ATP-dependent carboligase
MLKNQRKYACLEYQEIKDSSYILRAIQDDDIEDIRCWRNEQMDVLRQNERISIPQQQEYFERSIWPEMKSSTPQNILLTLFENGNRIGYGGLVHISWEHKRAEISFLLETSIALSIGKRSDLFSIFLKMVRRFAFEDLNLNKLTTETFDIRPDYVQVLEDSDFVFEGRLRNHVIIGSGYTDSLCHASFNNSRVSSKKVEQSCDTILITSAGSKTSLVNAVIGAARRASKKYLVFVSDMSPYARSKYVADGCITLPLIEQKNISTIVQICRDNNIRLIIPTRDGELSFWSSNKSFLMEHGISVIVSEPAAISTSIDKLKFANFGLANNLPIIPAWEDPKGLGPFVVKERFGAGSRSIALNVQKGPARAHGKSLSNPIYQPYVEGREISVDAWLDQHSKVKGLVLRDRDLIVNGESVVSTTFRNRNIEELCKALLELLPLHGPVVLQLILDKNGNPHVIELNARFGGASSLSISAGLDIWLWSILENEGKGIDVFEFEPPSKPLRQIRIQRDLVTHDIDI